MSFIIRHIKTGQLAFMTDNKDMIAEHVSKEEALKNMRKDFNKVNNGTRAFCKSYNLPVKEEDMMRVSDFEIFEVPDNIDSWAIKLI